MEVSTPLHERLPQSSIITELVVVKYDEGADQFPQGLLLALKSGGICVHVLNQCEEIADHR